MNLGLADELSEVALVGFEVMAPLPDSAAGVVRVEPLKKRILCCDVHLAAVAAARVLELAESAKRIVQTITPKDTSE